MYHRHLGYQGYKAEDIVLLTDDATDPRLIPTRQNMLNAMHWLVYNAHPHDALFFHCRSSHFTLERASPQDCILWSVRFAHV